MTAGTRQGLTRLANLVKRELGGFTGGLERGGGLARRFGSLATYVVILAVGALWGNLGGRQQPGFAAVWKSGVILTGGT